MRGSPIFRTLVVLALLALTGLALARLTHRGEPARVSEGKTPAVPSEAAPPAAALSARFHLILSAPAEKIELEAAGSVQHGSEGTLSLDPANPLVQLRIHWSSSEPGHRFAKLVLDPAGKDSISHVFEAPGDIDDLWEITP